MTTEFRKAAYEASQRAQEAGVGLDEVISFRAPPGTFQVRLRDLKQMLRNDQLKRKNRR